MGALKGKFYLCIEDFWIDEEKKYSEGQIIFFENPPWFVAKDEHFREIESMQMNRGTLVVSDD